MNKLFKPKCINRIIVFLALLAPIIYLFGTMGTYLMGAHGNLVLAQHETTLVTDVDYDGVSYSRVGFHGLDTCSFTFDAVLSTQGGSIYLCPDSYISDGEDLVGLSYSNLTYVDYQSLPVIYVHFWFEFFGESPYGELNLDDQTLVDYGNYCFSLAMNIDDGSYFQYVEFFVNSDEQIYYGWSVDIESGELIGNPFSGDDWAAVFGQGTAVYQESPLFITSGFMPDNAALNAVRHIPALPVVVESDDYVDNSDYLFGQMFPRDNFLAKVGQNALSDNPMGFVPFGTLLKFVDQNMLHMGASQLALMGYGYFYWCAHVLLLDVLFAAAVFFLRFIKSMFNRFEKGSD